MAPASKTTQGRKSVRGSQRGRKVKSAPEEDSKSTITGRRGRGPKEKEEEEEDVAQGDSDNNKKLASPDWDIVDSASESPVKRCNRNPPSTPLTPSPRKTAVKRDATSPAIEDMKNHDSSDEDDKGGSYPISDEEDNVFLDWTPHRHCDTPVVNDSEEEELMSLMTPKRTRQDVLYISYYVLFVYLSTKTITSLQAKGKSPVKAKANKNTEMPFTNTRAVLDKLLDKYIHYLQRNEFESTEEHRNFVNTNADIKTVTFSTIVKNLNMDFK
ncbi:predicted protein [Postia placenta Mad-698-R]|uniref:Uncharacterized protein n=1 Tax=Postia placenta MAD-698-R-SB12 TaxID=670580 RepID=A0A1X6MI82_9APHY|nr:hypothetical protein POSPLADRAFT_1161338 [Postia placenta MAD-698-R-SB12]EED81603.1 predicted protein [Postia placenta Mad-698-R]OSX56045.1 hypothetical protein POSPLADRAFT_1161338 [Postia placenta MAD-698-R-SB12]